MPNVRLEFHAASTLRATKTAFTMKNKVEHPTEKLED